MHKKSIAVILIAFLMSVIAFLFLFFYRSVDVGNQNSTQNQETLDSAKQIPTEPDVLFDTSENEIPYESEEEIIFEDSEFNELQVDTDF